MTDVFDVITVGRVGVDLYPEQSGVSLADVQTFRKSLGGSPVNVAVAAARLGGRAAGPFKVAAVTKVGDDAFGAYVRSAMEEFGVDTRWVGTDPELRTPVVFCEIHPPDSFPLLFYREPKAPDMNISLDELDLDAIRAARLFWTTGTGLSDEPSRSATLGALEARGRGGSRGAAGSARGLRKAGITVHDLDHRPMFWADEAAAGDMARAALAHATVAVGNQDEVEVAVGTRDPWEASEALLELGVELAIVKRGPEGVLARTRDETIEVEPIRLEVVNGLGAGDAFGGALAYGLLAGEDTELVIRRANAAGALVASRLACADDMPYLPELEELVAGSAAR
jgi:5-dehydro-2-deoxygluconokinase